MGVRHPIPAGVTTGADVELGSLSVGDRVGSGARGVVFEFNGSRRLVYKQYGDPSVINGEALSGLVHFRLGLNTPDRRWIDGRCAWPMCRVTQYGVAVGFIMRRAPSEYTWKNGFGRTRLLELQYLIRSRKEAWAQVPQPSAQERLQLSVKFIELVRRLHGWGVVIGDISHANILWKLNSRPDMYLIDCDSVRLRGHDPVAPQPATDQWTDEYQSGRPTFNSDRYKSALVLGRILSCDPYYRPDQPISFVSGVLSKQQEVAVRGLLNLAGRSTNRPPIESWVSIFADYIGKGDEFPAKSLNSNGDKERSGRTRPTIWTRRQS
jgi:hypothetical protein